MPRCRRHRRSLAALALASVVGLGLVPAWAAAEPGDPGAPAPAGAVPETLTIMTFNIEYGGTIVDLDAILDAIRRADADVVAFNEVYGKAPRLGRLTGYDFVSRRLDVISRYPIVDAPGAQGRYAFIQLAPDRVVALANVHLGSADYGPRRILDGWSRRRVLRVERGTRVVDLRPFLQATDGLAEAGIPTFIVGDTNSPSHQDWTTSTVGLRPQMRFPVAWPVTRLLERRGFVDAWRTVFPDPVADPGLTWPAGRPRSETSWNPRRDAPQDRIDQIWSTGPATAVDAVLVGERGGPGVGVSVRPWGSDHRAPVATFDVTAGTPPVMVSPSPGLVEIGRTLAVTYHAPGDPGERIRIVPRGGDPVTDAIDSLSTPPAAPTDGTLGFPTDVLPPGRYDVVMIDGSDAELARAPVWVREPDAPPLLDVPWRRDTGESVVVSFTSAPGNRFDWIGLYERGADPSSYLDYRYAGGVEEGAVTFDPLLTPGRYVVRYMLTDVYRVVATSGFVVRS